MVPQKLFPDVNRMIVLAVCFGSPSPYIYTVGSFGQSLHHVPSTFTLQLTFGKVLQLGSLMLGTFIITHFAIIHECKGSIPKKTM